MRVGTYEITALLGAGGMGVVYRARDTRLGRDVAIKVLLPSVVQNPERLARFEREARTLASLNHPRIAQIYGLEEGAGPAAGPFLVMELVEGTTLADRIAAGPLPLGEALAVARQIIEALDAAHEQGIVHRDLKPANIKVRSDSSVKVLDFGLAKAVEPGAEASSATQSPTLTSPAMTQAGMILGTAAYMSPEQARGRTVDRRTDIWAFGCVLFEMLSGRRAFEEDDVTGTLAAVVLKEPDWSRLPADTPPEITRLLRSCLQKDPKQRVRDIADLAFFLDGTAVGTAGGSIRVSAGAPRWAVGIAAAVALAAAGLAALQTYRLARTAPDVTRPVHFSITTPPGFHFAESLGSPDPVAALSPDGTRLIVPLQRGAMKQLFARRLDEDEMKPIPGTQGARAPFFSPDGTWIAFSDGTRLKKLPIEGGTPSPIGPDIFGTGAWMADDTIVFTPNYSSGLWKLPAAGGTPAQLTAPNVPEGELGHFWPQALPDGTSVLFTNYRSPVDRSRIEIWSLGSGARKVVVDGAFFGRIAGGYLIYAKSDTVYAAPFDTARQQVTGPAFPVLSDASMLPPGGLARVSVSNTGTLGYVPRDAIDGPGRMAWLDRGGRETAIGDVRRRFEYPRLSPDGHRIAVTIDDDQNPDIWVYDIESGTFSRITSAPTTERAPVWTSDGRRLFFLSEEPIFHIFSKLVDSTQEPERVLGGPFDIIPLAANRDFLVYERHDPKTRSGVWLLPLQGKSEPRAFVDSPALETDGSLSPDGKWLAYTSDESGRSEVYVNSFPDAAVHMPVSSNGGRWPVWARDGKELFFLQDDKMMAAAVRDGRIAHPDALFERRLTGYDVAPDGRFIVVLPDEAPQTVNVVVNWLDELKRGALAAR
jgi:Tol biopolymer transport system component